MQAALKRMRDRRQPADSGEFQAVPIRFNILRPQRPARPLPLPPEKPLPAKVELPLILAVPVLQATWATTLVWTLAEPVEAVFGDSAFMALVLLPAVSAALAAAIVSSVCARLRVQWVRPALRVNLCGQMLWIAILAVWAITVPVGAKTGPVEFIAALAVILVLGGIVVTSLSLPGSVAGVFLMRPLLLAVTRRRQRDAHASYCLNHGWRAP